MFLSRMRVTCSVFLVHFQNISRILSGEGHKLLCFLLSNFLPCVYAFSCLGPFFHNNLNFTFLRYGRSGFITIRIFISFQCRGSVRLLFYLCCHTRFHGVVLKLAQAQMYLSFPSEIREIRI
jgi:hypothetical protein